MGKSAMDGPAGGQTDGRMDGFSAFFSLICHTLMRDVKIINLYNSVKKYDSVVE